MFNSRSRTQSAARPRFQRPQLRSRAGLVMTPAMDFGGFEQAEDAFFQGGVALAPLAGGKQASAGVTVLPAAGLADLCDGALGGVIVPGAVAAGDNRQRRKFADLVTTAQARHLPIMAFGAGVADTLEVLGYEAPAGPPPAILVRDGVRILETMDEVRDGIRAFHAVARTTRSVLH